MRFAIPHDAADPIGFTFRTNGAKMALVTDLGYMPELVKVHLRDADCLMLESNHDLDMLKVGPYPWVVKQRVLEPHWASCRITQSANISPIRTASTPALVTWSLRTYRSKITIPTWRGFRRKRLCGADPLNAPSPANCSSLRRVRR